MECEILRSPMISYRSLLYSTTVLYDIIIVTGIAVLRKHYHMLLANLPDDHVTTVGIFSESVPVGEVFFNEVISFTDHNIANEKILNAAIMLVNYDTQFKGFAQLAKILVKRDCKFSREMLEFDIGKVYVSSCTQLMHTYIII